MDDRAHPCHANGCEWGEAHAELPFCKAHFNTLPEPHRKKLWDTRPKGVCGACLDAESDVAPSDEWRGLFHLALAILLMSDFGGCGAPPTYQDEEGFCWACGVDDALKNEAVAKKVIVKFGIRCP